MLKNKLTLEVIKGSFQTLGIVLKEMLSPPNKKTKKFLVIKYYEENGTSDSFTGKDNMLEPAPQTIDSEGLK